MNSFTCTTLIVLPDGREYDFGFLSEEIALGEHKLNKVYSEPPKTAIYEIKLVNLSRISEEYAQHEREFTDHIAHIARDSEDKPYVCFSSPSQTKEGAKEILTNWSILTVHHLLTGEDFNKVGDPKAVADSHSMKVSHCHFIEPENVW